jgi:hypothetical protein
VEKGGQEEKKGEGDGQQTVEAPAEMGDGCGGSGPNVTPAALVAPSCLVFLLSALVSTSCLQVPWLSMNLGKNVFHVVP